MKKISVVVPMYYEEEIVDYCYKELTKVLSKIKKYTYEIIFVNDGSKDKTLELLENISKKDKNIKVISFSRNFGHQAAVSAGLKYVTGDACIIIDADLQDPPKLIPKMIKLWESGYEVVYGKRKSREGESKFKLLTAKIFYKVLNALSIVEIPKDTGDFRLVDKKCVDTMNSLKEHNKFLRGLWSFNGFNQIELLYEREERIAGKTKYTLNRMLNLAMNGIIGFSYKPFSLIIIISIILFLCSICFLIPYIILNKISYLIIFLSSLGVSIITFCIWILTLYLSRILDEVRDRPNYIIDKTINIKEVSK